MVLVCLSALALALRAPIPQDPSYHAFADRRAFLRIPNFLNVLSNLPFLLVGGCGLRALRRDGLPAALSRLHPAYATCFLGLMLVGVGSAYYHLDPNNGALVWDRLPMTIAFMAFMAIIVGEYIDVTWGRRCLPWLVLLGIASVIYWWYTEANGRGDLRPYILVQFFPILMTLLILLLFPSPASLGSIIWGILSAYATAKVFELLDEPIYTGLNVVSGHTLKHLTAAAGMYLLVLAVRRRSAKPTSARG